MNKFLLASTALVASATFAMADVTVSGSAEMGVFGVDADGFGVDDSDLQFHTDIDVTFSMAGETDGGLTFGANIDLDESDDGTPFANDTQGGEVIFVDGAYGRLSMGDVDGAYDFAMEEAIIGGAINDDHEHAGYSGNAGLDGRYDGQVALYQYAFGDFSVGASAEIDDNGDDDPVLGLGARYSGDFGGVAFGAGFGFQTTDGDDDGDDRDVYGLSLSAKMTNGFSAILNYSEYDGFTRDLDERDETVMNDVLGVPVEVDAVLNVDVENHLGLAVGYEFGNFLIAANYGRFDTNGGDIDGYGVVANYDLGGGAALQAGYGHSDIDSDNDTIDGFDADRDLDTYSFGISMSF